MLPKVAFSFPTGDDRVFGTSQIDLSFYTTNFEGGRVCLTLTEHRGRAGAGRTIAPGGGAENGAESDAVNASSPVLLRTCVGAQEHAWRVSLPGGYYRAVAHLHDGATGAMVESR